MTLLQFLDGHYRSSGTDRSFCVDDQSSSDKSPSFCNLIIQVGDPDAEAFDLILEHVPWDEHVEDLVEEMGGEWSGTSTVRTLTLSLTITTITGIRKLAQAIRKVAGRGRRYSDPNWKWVTRRTAKSLQVLADRLIEYRRARRPSLAATACDDA